LSLHALVSSILDGTLWIAAQSSDPWCSEVRQELLSKSSASHLRFSFAIQHGLLVHLSDRSGFVLVAPKAMRQQVIASQHDSPEAGHTTVR
jgi:hypothetical protein